MKSIVMLLSNPFRPDPRVYKEAESLQQKGYQIYVICWDRLKEFTEHETLDSGVIIKRIQDIPSAYGIGLRQIPRLLRFWQRCVHLLNTLHPDLVHCHDFDTLPAGLIWGKSNKRPVIYDAHEYYADLVKPRLHSNLGEFTYHAIQYFERLASGWASAIITVDDKLGYIYRQYHPRVMVIGHYPPLKFTDQTTPVFQHLNNGAPVRLLYIGRISTDRGMMVYLDLLRRLTGRNIPVKLILVGVFTPALEKQLFFDASHGMEKDIEYIEWVPFSEIQTVLLSADVGLVLLQPEPRYTQSLPVKLFEYMAAGLPVIASDFPPLAEIINKVQCGNVIQPDNAEAGVQVLCGWLEHPQIAIEMGKNGQSAVRERYHWENLAHQIDQLYQTLIGA